MTILPNCQANIVLSKNSAHLKFTVEVILICTMFICYGIAMKKVDKYSTILTSQESNSSNYMPKSRKGRYYFNSKKNHIGGIA